MKSIKQVFLLLITFLTIPAMATVSPNNNSWTELHLAVWEGDHERAIQQLAQIELPSPKINQAPDYGKNEKLDLKCLALKSIVNDFEYLQEESNAPYKDFIKSCILELHEEMLPFILYRYDKIKEITGPIEEIENKKTPITELKILSFVYILENLQNIKDENDNDAFEYLLYNIAPVLRAHYEKIVPLISLAEKEVRKFVCSIEAKQEWLLQFVSQKQFENIKEMIAIKTSNNETPLDLARARKGCSPFIVETLQKIERATNFEELPQEIKLPCEENIKMALYVY